MAIYPSSVGYDTGSWTRIATGTLAADGIIDIQNIPTTYNYLRFVFVGSGKRAGANDNFKCVVNNDTTAAKYADTYTLINVAGALTAGTSKGGAGYMSCGFISADGGPQGQNIIEFSNKDTLGKVANWSSGNPFTTIAGDIRYSVGTSFFNDTTNRITRLTFSGAATANLATGSTYTLYGA